MVSPTRFARRVPSQGGILLKPCNELLIKIAVVNRLRRQHEGVDSCNTRDCKLRSPLEL